MRSKKGKTETKEIQSLGETQQTVSNAASILENNQVGISLNQTTGALACLHNKLTGEYYHVENDAFQIQTHETLAMSSFRLNSVTRNNDRLNLRYNHLSMTIEVEYRLYHHFLRKFLTILPAEDCIVQRIVVGSPEYSGDQLLCMIEYRYQMNKTFFGRTPMGGFFTGLELPFDNSCAEDDRVTLVFSPNYRLRKREKFECEASYFGVYQRMGDKANHLRGELRRGDYHNLPLPAESAAMVAMTSAILGPPRHGPVSVLSPCASNNRGWQAWYHSHAEVEENKKVLDFAHQCSVGWVQDFMPWSGETEKVNNLKEGDVFKLHAWSCELRDYAEHLGLKPILWSTMTNSQPWTVLFPGTAIQGQPFRLDCPDWLVKPVRKDVKADVGTSGGNCLGSKEFMNWLECHFRSVLDQGFRGFSLDGDFFGTGGWYTYTGNQIKCMAGGHEHAPGYAQYACTKALLRFLQTIRAQYPDAFLWLMRPMMDLGVWVCKNGDAVFPIDECASLENLTDIEHQPNNVLFGDKIRIWSRIRVQYHFIPHYLDQVYLFPGVNGGGEVSQPWQSERLDYLMLSAISSTPNQCYFTGPSERVPADDRKTIKQWLDWGRANAKYLMVRRDLPAWPRKDVVDGSSHIIDDCGFIFLFNPNEHKISYELDLTSENIGISENGACRITQAYPYGDLCVTAAHGDAVKVEMDGYGALLLNVSKI